MSRTFLPQSLNDIFSWEVYEKLPKIGDVDVFMLSNQFRYSRSFSAWHVPSNGVFPHTKRYRLMRSILENDINELK